MPTSAKTLGGAQSLSALAEAGDERISRRGMLTLFGASSLVSLMGCDAHSIRLTASGATTLTPPVETIMRAFMNEYPDIRGAVTGGGTSVGVQALRRRTAQVALLARDPSAQERAEFDCETVARDGIAIVASMDADLPGSLTEAEVRAYFTKTMPGADLMIVDKAVGHGTSQAFRGSLGLNGPDVVADVEANANGQVIATVAQSRNALGYVASPDAEAAVRDGRKLRILAVDGARPTQANIASGAYPMVRTLWMATRRLTDWEHAAQDDAALSRLRDGLWPKRFVEFAKGPVGRGIFERHGFTPREGET